MFRFRCCHLLVLGSIAAVVLLAATSTAIPDEPKNEPAVRLAVLVIFDQFRGDYPSRWESLYGEGGFRRLAKEGVWFQNCHYPYSGTETGPGHASLATGTAPDRHGIIFNEWYERGEGGEVYCTGHLRYQRVPAPPKKDPDPKQPAEKYHGEGSPVRLLAPTLADALKDAKGAKSRVVALSMKDRSAVLPGGHKPDACYWFDPSAGAFVTSTYYRDSLHPWVAEYNATKPADVWFGKTWTRFRPDLDYEKYSGPDDVLGEGTGYKQGKTFPHMLDGGLKEPGKTYYEAIYTSPFGNDVLLGLVKKALDAEQLGKHDAPDLLCVSFSSNDPIGHVWGPDSQEVLDTTLRTDALMKDLLATLDAKVGKDRYILALSADHGVCPMPEVSVKQGKQAKRLLPADLKKATEEFLEKTFPRKDAGQPIAMFYTETLYLNRDWVKKQGVPQAVIEQALAEWLKTQPGILTAYPRSRILKGLPEDDAIGRAVMRSFHPERSGDVVFIVKPYHLLSSRLTGTGHGTPHPYDTHVPLMVIGPGLVPAIRQDRISPQANVQILAKALGIQPPEKCDFPLPENVFAK